MSSYSRFFIFNHSFMERPVNSLLRKRGLRNETLKRSIAVPRPLCNDILIILFQTTDAKRVYNGQSGLNIYVCQNITENLRKLMKHSVS